MIDKTKLVDRKEKGMPNKDCLISILYKDSGKEEPEMIECVWYPFDVKNYINRWLPSDGYIGTAKQSTGRLKGIGFHAWKGNDSEFRYYKVIS